MNLRRVFSIVIALLAGVSSGCGGSGSGALTPAAAQPTASASPVTSAANDITFMLSIPASATSAVTHVHPADTSAATQSVTVAIATRVLKTANVASGSSACTNASGGGRTCSIPVAAPAGSDTFTITTYDQANGTGNVLASANVVEAVSTTSPSVAYISVDAAIAKIGLTLSNPYPPIGTSTTINVVVSGFDADGNTVIGSFATPATLRDADPTGDTTLSTTTFASASSTVLLSYNGGYPLISALITATMGSLSASATFAPIPSFLATYQAPSQPPPDGPGFSDIVLGPDGDMYVIGTSYSEFVKIAPNGARKTYRLPSSSDYLLGLVVGADGNLWSAENQNNSIAKFDPQTGVITEYSLPTGTAGVALADAVTRGNDGNVWFTDERNDVVGSITTSGVVTEYALPANGNPVGITVGPDGNFWISDSGNNAIIKFSPAGAVLASYTIPTANSSPNGITPGPDGNVWFTETVAGKIARITTSGAITEFAIPTGLSTPLNIVAGPDGRMWFSEMGAQTGIGKIGYITTDGSQMREFLGDGIHVYDLAFDDNDTLWYVGVAYRGPGEIGTFAY